MLSVTVQNLDGILILRCFGGIVSGEETAISCPVSRHDGIHVVLDLGEVDAIDAAGIGLLISLQAAGFYLTLVNPSVAARRALTTARLDSVFEIVQSESMEGRTGESAPDFPPESNRSAPCWGVAASPVQAL